MSTRLRATCLTLLAGAALGGCVYRERTVPAASPATTVVVAPAPGDRVVTYPEGRYELRGDGTTASPYFWVWIPAGATPPNPPPLPRRPQTE
jgi:methyl coenzyme M reductase subunit C